MVHSPVVATKQASLACIATDVTVLSESSYDLHVGAVDAAARSCYMGCSQDLASQRLVFQTTPGGFADPPGFGVV